MTSLALRPIEGRAAFDRLNTLLSDPASEYETIHDVVSCMPILAAHVLGRANARETSGELRINRIDRAIILLGRDDLLVLLNELRSQLEEPTVIQGISLAALIRHHVVVSRAAELLARAARLPIAAEARAAGLLHDVGILAQLQRDPVEFSKALQAALDTRSRLTEHEGLYCGEDHCAVGERVLSDIGVCSDLVGAVVAHHDPLTALERHRYMAILLYAAECLARRAGFRDLHADDSYSLENDVLSTLRLDDAFLRAHVPTLRNTMQFEDRILALNGLQS